MFINIQHSLQHLTGVQAEEENNGETVSVTETPTDHTTTEITIDPIQTITSTMTQDQTVTADTSHAHHQGGDLILPKTTGLQVEEGLKKEKILNQGLIKLKKVSKVYMIKWIKM